MNKQERGKYCEQAKALLEEAGRLSQEAEKLWQKQVDLLRKVYPEANPQDKIQVEIVQHFPKFRRVGLTSFSDISLYGRAVSELGWHYGLYSEQVCVCYCCDEYYYIDEGEESEDDEGLGIGFCTLICLENYEIKCAEEADHLEYMMECFPDQYELIDGKIHQKARTPQQQENIRCAWERAIEYQENKGE